MSGSRSIFVRSTSVLHPNELLKKLVTDKVKTAPALLNVDEISTNIIEGKLVSLNYI
uniref:Uncharacterized protein n=1 Tax=Amphimedon queenslandica TaxID=400682 RepID=A0A1X7TV34_AMPQE